MNRYFFKSEQTYYMDSDSRNLAAPTSGAVPIEAISNDGEYIRRYSSPRHIIRK